MGISDDNKPKKCGAEFEALKTAFNKIIEEYKGIPAKLKGDGVKRVPLKFEDTDIGSTDLKDSKRVCEFAKKLVTRLKDAEDNHKKRLAAARKLVCTKAGDLLKNKLVTNLVKCLRDAKKAADKGSDATAKKDAKEDVDKVDNNGLKRVSKLLGLLKGKCLMKDTTKSSPARVAGLFKEKLKTKIKRKKTGALTTEEKKAIADKLSTAVKKKHEKAMDIVTTFSDDKGTRRQLRPRRELEGTVSAETTYGLDEPSKASDKVDVDLGTDFDVVETDVSSDSTSGTIEVTETLSEISAELPTGEDTTPKKDGDDTTPKKDGDDTSKETTEEAKVASGATFFVSASAICATLLFV